MFLKEAKNWWVEALFPFFCVSCGREGRLWCQSCWQQEPGLAPTVCFKCGRPGSVGWVCFKCSRHSALSGVSAPFRYAADTPAGQLIRYFKYEGVRVVAGIFKDFSFSLALPDFLFLEPITIIPVPLHPRRERERGFNQSALIAKIIEEKYRPQGVGIDENGLVRCRYTKQQAKIIDVARRADNLKDAFVWVKNTPAPKRVILVDDVITTGATSEECARALRRAGSQLVWVFALARA